MKKALSIFLILLLFAVFLVACGASLAPEDSEPETQPLEQVSEPVPKPEPESVPEESPNITEPDVPSWETPLDAPSWEVALEEFLSEFLPIFTPGTVAPYSWVEWLWEVGGWGHFVREYTFEDELGYARTGFYLADPMTGETVDADDVPYAFTPEGWTAIFIATDFYLHDIDGDGIPALLIRWHPLGGDFEMVQMFRYLEGRYTPISVSVRSFWQYEAVETPFLFSTALFSGGSELLARDSEGRTLVLGAGGAGGFGTWAYVLHLEDNSVRLEQFFNIRYGWDRHVEGRQFQLSVNTYIMGDRASLPAIEMEEILFFPWEWAYGLGDMTPVPIPIMPDVTVVPFPRMTDLEQLLTERITARLLAEGRILSQ